MQTHRLPPDFAVTATQYYVPLAKQAATKRAASEDTLFIGVNGCQGSGKSTMSAYLAEYLKQEAGLTCVVLSLDDFYLSRKQRQDMAVKVHPLFATRGVPGTHNTDLVNAVLSSLSGQKGAVHLPAFDKANDNPLPQSEWRTQSLPVDIVIMEGWCWGVEPQQRQVLKQPVNQLEDQQDALGVWRNYVNNALKEEYKHLYDYMDYWVMLRAPDFTNVFNWRLEQEQKLAETVAPKKPKHLMSADDIAQFIQYYQRLTEHGLSSVPQKCDVVFQLDAQRHIENAQGLQ